MKTISLVRGRMALSAAAFFGALLSLAPSAVAYQRFGDFSQYDSPGNTTQCSFDLYLPNTGVVPGAPTIIDLHGGGYTTGDKQLDWQVCGALADRGYNVISMNYTLAVAGVSSSFPQTFRDVRAMIRWVRTEGVTLGLSPTIVVIGQSAGATIGIAAAYAPETPDFVPPGQSPPGGYRVDAIVGMFGRYDLVWDAQTYGTSLNVYNYLLMGYNQPGGPARFAAAAAKTYVNGCSPPSKLIVGDADPVVPWGNTTRLAAALTNAGVFNILQVVPGAGHGTGPLGNPLYLATSIAADLPQLLAQSNPTCGLVPPANDACISAVTLAPGQTIHASTIGATADGASPCGRSDTRDVWFRFTAPETRRYGLSLSGTTGLAKASLTAFASCSAGSAVLACDDSSLNAEETAISLVIEAGQSIVLRVAGDNGASGIFAINADFGEPFYPPPLNDACAAAAPLSLGAFAIGTTLGAAIGPPGPCGNNDVIDVWFSFVAPMDGRYRFETYESAGLTDTTLAAYNVCGLSPVACNDDASASTDLALLDLRLNAGQPILLRVAGNQMTAGSFLLGASMLATVQGACCAGGSCSITEDDLCGAGVFTAQRACDAVPCNPIGLPPGACCSGANCTITDQPGCSASFKGVGTTCGAAGNPTTCCRANINGINGLSVQDIFDFLAGYFGGQPVGDFNVNGSLTVQDIFDFLSAYFTGCN